MKKLTFLLLSLIVVTYSSYASHLRAGYIQYEQLSGFTYRITVTVFTDIGSDVLFGDGFLDFGDGSDLVQVPQTDNVVSAELGPGVGSASFSIEHTYPSAGSYRINYTEPNRNEGVLNMTNSGNSMFNVKSMLNIIDPSQLNSSPLILTAPVFFHNYNDDLALSLACYDVNDYKLRYVLRTPKSDKDVYINNYQLPDVRLDSITGLLTWAKEDIAANAQLGEYAFAVEVAQYTKLNGRYQMIGSMIYDFQIILEDISGQISITNSESIIVQLNTQSSDTLYYVISSEPEPTIEVNSELEEFANVIQYEVTGDSLEKQLKLVLSPSASIDRDNPYVINIRAKAGKLIKDYNILLYTRDIQEPDLTITSIDEKTRSNIRIYPQPNGGIINVTNIPTGAEYQIYTYSGQLLVSGNTNGKIDVSPLPAGLYILTVSEEKYQIVKD